MSAKVGGSQAPLRYSVSWRDSIVYQAYNSSIEKERNPTQESIDDRLRKRKRRAITVRAADVGKEAQDMRIPNEDNYKTKKVSPVRRTVTDEQFWTVDADGHLIRPITIRPTHPLPRPDVVVPKKADGKKRRNPPSRLNMRIINPTLWKPTHLNELSLEDGETEREDEGWEFESASEEEEDEEGKILAGRWLKSTEAGVEAEEVWVSGKAVPEYLPVEEEDVIENRVQGSRSVSPLFAGRRDRSASPLFPSQQGRAEGSASPLFGIRRQIIQEEMPATLEVEREESEDDFPLLTNTATPAAPTTTTRLRSASPLFASRSTISTKQTERPAPASAKPVERPPPAATKQAEKPIPAITKQVTKQAERHSSPIAQRTAVSKSIEPTLPDPVRDTARAEKSRDLGLLASFLGEDVTIAAKPARGEWAGFDEEDEDEVEDDEFEGVQPLRIRGGKGDEDEDEDMEDSSSEDSDSDSDSSSVSSDSDSDDDAEVKVTTPYPATATTSSASAPAPTPAPGPARTQSVLKAMFAPAPATSSFLLGALDADIELDEELDIPLAPPPIKQAYEPAAALQPLAASKKSHFDPDSSIPLFFPTFGKGGKDAMKEDTEKEGYVGFWKQETDEEMKAIWENDKVELTRDWKKRYRDGKKQRKRRGGGNDVE